MATVTHYTKLDLTQYIGKTVKSVETYEYFGREDEELAIVFTDDTKLIIRGSSDCGEPNLFITGEE